MPLWVAAVSTAMLVGWTVVLIVRTGQWWWMLLPGLVLGIGLVGDQSGRRRWRTEHPGHRVPTHPVHLVTIGAMALVVVAVALVAPPRTTAPEPPRSLGVGPLHLAALGRSLSCSEALNRADPAALVSAFRAARLRGFGAEGCLTPQADARYDDAHCDEQALISSPGPLVLYQCAGHRVSDISNATLSFGYAQPWTIQLETDLAGANVDGNPIEISEHLTIGRAVAVGTRKPSRQVITDVNQY